jgi:hypothetical protein
MAIILFKEKNAFIDASTVRAPSNDKKCSPTLGADPVFLASEPRERRTYAWESCPIFSLNGLANIDSLLKL